MTKTTQPVLGVIGLRFLASLAHCAPTAPIGAAAITVAVYSKPLSGLLGLPPVPDHALIAALVNLLAAWLGLSILDLLAGLSNRDRANATSYQLLQSRLDELKVRVEESAARCAPSDAPGALCDDVPFDVSGECERLARNDMWQHFKASLEKLDREGPQWVTGSAYIDLWRRVHRAREAWLYLAPVEEVIADAEDACLRITGSEMGDVGELKRKLAQALAILRSPNASSSAPLRVPATSGQANRVEKAVGLQAATNPDRPISGAALRAHPVMMGRMIVGQALRAIQEYRDKRRPGAVAHSRTEHMMARLIVSQARRAIHEYRDDRWDGLRQARNHLSVAMGIAGVTVYMVLWLAIVAGAEVQLIQGAAAVYLVGATVSVFNLLYSQIHVTKVTDDYGLALGGLLINPHLSGIAAILGVGLLALATRSSAGLAEAFDLGKHSANLFEAAVFGLTPGLLIERLRQHTDETKKELKSTDPGQGMGEE